MDTCSSSMAMSSSGSYQIHETVSAIPAQTVSLSSQSSQSSQISCTMDSSPDQSICTSASSSILDTSEPSPDKSISPSEMVDSSKKSLSAGENAGSETEPESSVHLQSMIRCSDALDTTPRRKSRVKDDRICLVCGDKALGYNFNAMTCESCKAFFRRNALKPNTAACLFQGNCQIDVRTRRFCPHCRLLKCYSVGMKRDMILDDSERKARMQKVLENRKRKLKSSDSVEENMKQAIKEEPCEADMLPDQSDSSQIQSSNAENASNSLSDALTGNNAVDLKVLRTPPVLKTDPDSKDPSLFRILAPAEYILFEDLGEAYGSTLGELLHERLEENSYNNCNDLINNSTVAVKRLIKFIKRLEDFYQLNKDDQIAALKACVLSSIILRSSCFYSTKRDSWITGTGEISTSILKKSTGYSELYEIHTNFCRSLKELIGDDKILFALVQVICIFSPECNEIREKGKMSSVQDKYIILLKHYLEWEFSYPVAKHVFAKLLAIIADMKRISDAHNAIILQANPSDIEPLMLEVLDLKSIPVGPSQPS
ncbi:nuclear hormone receptor HR96-like [Mercenaria mercenaria]|uniref:nuclear hormone receptor HR96-like n=1 Tax=Mercenaria mercenaria TaxID=6596 RepID=UPI00234F3173|nr:nuclear hormone receptor HR96-like [Mercenaria mercenaria]